MLGLAARLSDPRSQSYPQSHVPSHSRGTRHALAVASIAFALTSTAQAQWSATSLHPAGATNSRALGTFGGQHVGQVDGEAAVWNGTSNSYVDLGPGYAVATDGQYQVGQDAVNHPRRWAGTQATGVGLPYGTWGGYVTGLDLGIAVGWIYLLPHSAPDVNLPASWSVSTFSGGLLGTNGPEAYLYGVSAGTGVGSFRSTGGAGMWPGLVETNFVDLHPVGSTQSAALDLHGGTQVGWATFGTKHAGQWSGSAASWVDLAPTGSSESQALAVFGARTVGSATFGGSEHAGTWTGSASSWLDLHVLLPAGYTESRATGIWADAAGSEFVCGWARNASGNTEAILWRSMATGSTFCAGDGSVTPCPCGNQGAALRGCPNSLEPLGARLVANGVASVGNDQLQLNVVGVPNGPGLFFQGSIQVAGGLGSTFGDGLRCAGGSIVRLGIVVANANTAQYPRPGVDPSVSTQGSAAIGGFYAYQYYYRDTASFCTTATFNLTNGVLLSWLP